MSFTAELQKLYSTVARVTGFSEDFVRRVALGEESSKLVEMALEKELRAMARADAIVDASLKEFPSSSD